jgi:hypothetical protein
MFKKMEFISNERNWFDYSDTKLQTDHKNEVHEAESNLSIQRIFN